MCFPYTAAISRRIDLDHTIPYPTPTNGGPPGQTRIGNLGPHTRRNHRHKTHGGWQVRQPEPGTWLWRTPHRRIYLVNATGTHPLGNTDYAQAIWRAASPPEQLASGPTLDREIDRDRAWGPATHPGGPHASPGGRPSRP